MNILKPDTLSSLTGHHDMQGQRVIDMYCITSTTVEIDIAIGRGFQPPTNYLNAAIQHL